MIRKILKRNKKTIIRFWDLERKTKKIASYRRWCRLPRGSYIVIVIIAIIVYYYYHRRKRNAGHESSGGLSLRRYRCCCPVVITGGCAAAGRRATDGGDRPAVSAMCRVWRGRRRGVRRPGVSFRVRLGRSDRISTKKKKKREPCRNHRVCIVVVSVRRRRD